MFCYSKRERLVCERHRRKIYKQYKYKGVLTVCGMDWFFKGDGVLLWVPRGVFFRDSSRYKASWYPWDISSIDFYRAVNPKRIKGKSSGKFIWEEKKGLAVGQQKRNKPPERFRWKRAQSQGIVIFLEHLKYHRQAAQPLPPCSPSPHLLSTEEQKLVRWFKSSEMKLQYGAWWCLGCVSGIVLGGKA